MFTAIAAIITSLLFITTTASADDTTTPPPSTTILPSLLDETRFLLPTGNSTNIQVSAISVIGATLIAIAAALAIGGLLPAVTGAVSAAGLVGKRSIPEEDPYSIYQIMSVIDGIRGFNVDCQKKVSCEIHRERDSIFGTTIGDLTDRVVDAVNDIIPTNMESYRTFVRRYREAAEHGKENQDCERVYSACEYSVRKAIRSVKDYYKK